MEDIETWISSTGNYLVIVFSTDDDERQDSRVYKIVTNDSQRSHVDAPRLYASLIEAVNRVHALEAEAN